MDNLNLHIPAEICRNLYYRVNVCNILAGIDEIILYEIPMIWLKCTYLHFIVLSTLPWLRLVLTGGSQTI